MPKVPVKNPKTRNYTPAERALCFIGIIAGKSLEEINKQMGERKLNPRSYELLKGVYIQNLPITFDTDEILRREDARDQAVWEHCVNPKPMGKL